MELNFLFDSYHFPFTIVFFLILFYILLVLIEFLVDFCRKKASYQNQHVVITGGSSGIGKELALEFARKGSIVTILARGEEQLINTVQYIKETLGLDEEESLRRLHYEICDVTKPMVVKEVIDKIVNTIGPPAVIVCAAGFCIPNYLLDSELIDFHSQMDVNYFGTVNIVRHTLPHLLKTGKGHFVFLSSPVVNIGMIGYTSYSPSKAAVKAFSDSLRQEFVGTPLQFSIIYPPDTNTPGYQRENLIKPPETREICGKTIYFPQEVAQMAISGIQNGDYHIKGPNFVQNQLITIINGLTPRKYLFFEITFSWLFNLLASYYSWTLDHISIPYGKRIMEQIHY